MKQIRIWLVILLVFLAGAAAGAVTTRVITRHIMLAVLHRPELLQGHIERALGRKLDLTSQQREKIHDTLLDARGKLQGLRGEFHPRFMAIMAETHRQIAAQLTPEQQAKFEDYVREHHFAAGLHNNR
jgi:Spy/CpxP family protein refolding chaperone